ncbi:PREDICTED: protein THEM6 [Dufourea novaeangliae]|uniref:Protein THEM6 n=1 Tax=Dufourea novaeangliae TaxID=178035 RepID=A0A154NXG5_DUFNO|nr:PREDICTED: protein THEM6 [Dufourea novaeangliae]KZC04349.1 UPF0670 protein THEM6 like protein [Dufourea novaeangliae]
MVCTCVAFVVMVLYMLFDVNYFLRIFFTLCTGRLFPKKKILDTTTVYGICSTQDLDLVLMHMNNARYLRELDMARFYWFDVTGVYETLSKRGGTMVLGASTTRYRKALPLFMPYKITTRLIYWEDKHFYLEHQFITLTDGFVRTVSISKQTTVGVKVPASELLAELDPNIKLPEIPKDLQLWMNSMEESSQKLRKRD